MKSLLVAAILAFSAGLQPEAAPVVAGGCQREGATIVGSRPGTPSRGTGFPRKRVHKSPAFPSLPPGTSLSGNWLGELLVQADGTVARVWPIREPKLAPAFAPFNQSIVEALGQWQYEPWRIGGRARPFCTTVVVTIDH